MTAFWVAKMVPKILQANLIFYVVFATLASQTVLAEEAKNIQKSSPRCQQSGFDKTTRRVGECYLKMRTAPQWETQNRTKHFTVARNRNVL